MKVDEGKKRAIESMFLYIRKRGHTTIKSITEKEKPLLIEDADGGDSYQPDITARDFTSKYLYSIEDCKELDEKQAISKWKAFAGFIASQKSGRFYLVIPENKSDYINKLLETNKIEASLVKMKTL